MRIVMFVVLAALFGTGQAFAALEWQLQKPLELKQTPLAMVSSSDGKRLYVLGDQGSIEVFNAQGRRETQIPVPFKAEGLDISADGKNLYLKEAGKKRLQVIALEERFTIPQGGSPSKGAADAAVAVVVFSDFQ